MEQGLKDPMDFVPVKTTDKDVLCRGCGGLLLPVL
jgi:hypothetical protein